MKLEDIRKKYGLAGTKTETKQTQAEQPKTGRSLEGIRKKYGFVTTEQVNEIKAKPRLYKNEAEYYAANARPYDEVKAELDAATKRRNTYDNEKAMRDSGISGKVWQKRYGEKNTERIEELARMIEMENKRIDSLTKEAQYGRAKEYNELAESEDFAAKSVYDKDIKPTAANQLYRQVNDPLYSTLMNKDATGQMTADEVKIFNYIYNTQGDKAAQEYFDYLKTDAPDPLDARRGREIAGEIKTDVGRAVYGGVAALGNAGQGIKQLFSEEAVKPTVAQYASAEAAEDIETKVGKFAYDLSATVGNMAPSILASTAVGIINPLLGKAVGSTLMGAASAGNTYTDAINSGMTPRQAMKYGAMVGASEAALESVLGGISKLGANPIGKAAGKLVSGGKFAKAIGAVDNAFIRAAAKLAGSMAGEIAEEELQLFLEPLFKTMATDEKYDAPEWEEIVYTALISAASAGLFEAPGNIAEAVEENKQKKAEKAKQAEKILKDAIAEHEKQSEAQSGTDAANADFANKVLDENAAQTANDTAEEKAAEIERTGVYSEMVSNYADSMDAAGQNVFIEAYDGSVEPDVYVREMQDAYDAGRRGEELAASETVIGDDRRQLAYKAGEADAAARKAAADVLNNGQQSAYNDVNTTETEGQENAYAGRYDLGRGSQWNDGENPVEQIQGVESRAGEDQAGRVNTRSRDEEAAALELGIQVSTNTLGIEGGSTNRDIRIVLDGETKATKAARDMLESRGLEVIFFAGNNLTITRGKDTASVRGYISGDRVYIRVDHPDFTAEQIAKHEATHDRIRRGEVTVADVRDRLIADGYDIDRVVDLYEEAYRGAGMSYDELLEEIVCDSEANINIFSSRRTIKADYILEVAQAVRKTERRPESARAPPAEQSEGKFSREITSDSPLTAIEEARQALKENDAEIRKLTAQLEKAKGQVKKTERPSLMKADVNRLAKKIIGDHASTLKTSDIYAELDALAKAVIKKGVDDVTVSDLAHTLAEKITESAEVLVDDGMRDDYRGIKKYLRETPIAFNDKSDIPDWNIFHKANIGRIRISQKGTGIDKVYIDLQERYGKALFPDNIDAPADQLLHFAELLDDLRDTYENPYDLNMAVAVEQTVNDILADIQTEQLRETPKTFADKANDKLKKARSKAVAAKNEALKKVRADRDKKIADLKERHKQSTEKAREGRKARELRGRITRHVADLSVKLRNPTDKQHIPERLRASVAKVLEAINLESAYSYDESGRRVKSREGVATKRTSAFAQLRKTYAEIAGDITVDPELVMAGGNLDIVLEMADTPIAEMTSAQLQTVWETLKAVETSIRTANKLFAAERFETVSSLTEALRRDNKGKKAAAEIFGWSALQRGVVLANESPETFFHLLGETGDYLFRILRNAQDRQTVLTAAVKRFTHGESMAAIKDAKAWEKEIHTVKLGGEDVKMSAAQIMELYVLSHRKAAMDHILIGGILPENAKGKGLKIESRVNPVRGVTMEELLDVFKVLTAEQKDIANKLQKFASTTLSEWGNEASMKVYGYKKFNEPDYWTIRTNKQETKSTTESFTGTPSIANKGFTKTTKPHANNSLMIGSIFDTFANHASEMVNYAAYLDVMEDVGKVRNFVFFDVDGQRSGSVKEIVDTVHGKTGSEWLEKLLTDIAVGTKGLGGKSWFDSLFAKAKATSVGANLSVIVQQPTAIIRAMAEINPRYFVSGKSALKGWKRATEYAPIAQWKDWGYFDIRSGRQMKELFFDTDTVVDKVTQLGMAPAGLMDSLSWGALWNAVENETKAKRTDLAPETKEFYQAAAKRFTEIVEKTQVVDGVLQRSDMMRSDNAFNRMATAFMGEPTKQYNMVIRAFYDVKYAGKGNKAKAAKKMVASSFVLLVSGVLNAAVKSLVGALRDDDKEKKYWEKWADTFAGENLKEFGKSNLGGTLNPLAYIPVVKDVVSLVQGYDISRMDMALVEEAVKAATNMQKAMNDEGGKTIVGASVDMMVALSKLTGIPVGNIKRDVESVINTIASESDNYLLQYRMEKAVKSIDYSGNKKQFMAILYGAYTNDKEAYEIIYNDLVESGYNVESIRDAMEDRMKEDQGVKSVAELEQRWLPPTEQSKYDSGVKKLEANKLWKKATSKQKDSVEADLYNYLAGTKKGESIAEDISGGKAVGLTDTEYMLYQLALEMCDEPTESGKMGVINQSEAKKALDMLDELSDREKAYLWSITNSGWKSNPWD